MDSVHTSGPVVVDLEEVATAVIHGVVPMAELANFFDRSFTELATVLDRQAIAPTGPAFARYAGPPGDTAQLEVGFPVGVQVAADGQVGPSTLPAGRAARLVHAGGYDRLGESWDALAAWIAEQDLVPGDVLCEVYVTQPNPDMDPADLLTELFWIVG
jgi:effector-binding domain-containing protein